MAEMDRFEARLAASLGRLADEVSTEVDPAWLTAAVAAAGRRRSWARPKSGARGDQLAPALRLALILAALLTLMYGMTVLAPRLVPTRSEVPSPGRIACEGEPWTTSAAGPLLLDCTSDLPDPRMAGSVRISISGLAPAVVSRARQGSMELHAGGAGWAGGLQLMTAPNGMVVGDAALVGDGSAAGIVLHLRLISADGVAWGVLAWTRTNR